MYLLNLLHNSTWKASDNLHLTHSVASNDDILGGFSYIVNLAWITLSRPACFGHVLAVLAQRPAKRLHASLQISLTSGLMGLSDTPVSAPVCFCPSVPPVWLVVYRYTCLTLCLLYSLCISLSLSLACHMVHCPSVDLPNLSNMHQMYFVF